MSHTSGFYQLLFHQPRHGLPETRQGAAYQIVFEDADGQPFAGSQSYKLTLPKDVPASISWSLTLYDAATASGLATAERRFLSLGSRDKPVMNADGTTDLYIGPKAPKGHEANWLQTAPGKGLLRHTAPLRAGRTCH
ncbi:MAG: DUF1214 domain-containing protein [Xanthobacter sp.]